MKHWHQGGGFRFGVLTLALVVLGGNFGWSQPRKTEPAPLLLVVMDPLAKELACACMAGYGQRDYRKLAAQLESTLKQRVNIEFSDDLADTLTLVGAGHEVMVVGERSRVAHGAKQAELNCRPVCELTDPDGSTTITGSFVVQARDPAQELKDLAGRKVFFGLAETETNHAATQAALRAAGITNAGSPEKRQSYSDAALDVLDSQATPLPVAVIPAYGLRLLEGCGSIKRGELRVIGKTDPVPFVTVFLADNIAPEKEQKILKLLLGLKSDAKLLKAMESRDGFQPVKTPPPAPQANAGPDWPDWRGPNRDGLVPRLPTRLPETAKLVWKKAAMTGGLAGLSVSNGRLILAERDFAEEYDVYRCLHADTGELLWRIEFPAAASWTTASRPAPRLSSTKAKRICSGPSANCAASTSQTVPCSGNGTCCETFKPPCQSGACPPRHSSWMIC
jgi:ABC-type phosphate/phosphonate transport system substrate-binding protein